MPRSAALTEDATRRFNQAVLDWWSASGASGAPGTDRIAAALNCDRRVVMRLRSGQPNDRNLLFALFAAQAKKPLSENHIILWELSDADFVETQIITRAGRLITEMGMLYQGANYDLAESRGWEALRLFQQQSHKGGEANAHHWLARVETARGRFDRALEHLDCAFALNRELKDNYLSADLYDLQGTILLRQGDWERSRKSYTQSLAGWKELKHLQAGADLEISFVALETKAGCAAAARTHLENARKTIETLKDGPLHAALLLQEARLLLLEGHPDAATDCANKALAYWTFAEHPRWKALSHLVLAEIAAKQCRAADASQHAAQSLKLYEQAGDVYGARQARQILEAAALRPHPA